MLPETVEPPIGVYETATPGAVMARRAVDVEAGLTALQRLLVHFNGGHGHKRLAGFSAVERVILGQLALGNGVFHQRARGAAYGGERRSD